MLVDDFGEHLLLPPLDQQSVDSLYSQAETCLLKIQQLQPNKQIFPNYNSKRLRNEMALFPHWFVGELLGNSLHKDETAMLERLFTSLVENALQQPQVLVHRDYHSRNLMLLADGDMGVIDFQDAVWGPVTYDLVSLLKDCYIRWPATMVRQRAPAFKQRLLAAASGLDIADQHF